MTSPNNPFITGEPPSEKNPLPVKVSSTSAFVIGEPTQEVAPLPVRFVSGMWRGTWAIDIDYHQNDTIYYAGSTYIARLDHISSLAIDPTDTDYWQLVAQGGSGGGGGFGVWRGSWSSLTAYVIDDVVEDAGSSYIAISNNTNQQPPNALYWNLVAAAGTDGLDGSTWYEGTGAPAGGLGFNGDFYLNDANGDVYTKAGGTWSVVANIKGPQGNPGVGIATGGTTGQVLAKASNTDFDTTWVEPGIPRSQAIALIFALG